MGVVDSAAGLHDAGLGPFFKEAPEHIAAGIACQETGALLKLTILITIQILKLVKNFTL